MSKEQVSPALSLNGFNCPHCGVMAQQIWFRAMALPLSGMGGNPASFIVKESENLRDASFGRLFEEISNNFDARKALREKRRVRLLAHTPVAPVNQVNKQGESRWLWPVWVSECFVCGEPTIWIDDRIIWPPTSRAPLPNPDLPSKVMKVYEEARSILELSPSGAAALLRKALEMLCRHCGGNGRNLYDTIESLLTRPGFSELAVKSAHTIRLFGNEELHSGAPHLERHDFLSIQEDDDAPTAEGLFEFLNLVADEAITKVKRINAWHSRAESRDRARKEGQKLG